MFEALDRNNDNQLDFNELVTFVGAARQLGMIKPSDLVDLIAVDKGTEEFITSENEVEVESSLSDSEIAIRLLSRMDSDNNDHVSLEEFLTLNQKLSFDHFF
eukprot:g5944.t1